MPHSAAASAPPPWTPPAVGELAGRFPELELQELLGRGGMGAVYKARQKNLDRLVALKILPPERGQDPAFAGRFAREAQAMARLSHPNIVTIYEFGEREGLYYFMMEYVDGVSLRGLLDGGKVAAREALAIVPQICEALQYAHDRGIVHRDIKPENILLNRQGQVKIADFGLAKLMGRVAGEEQAARTERGTEGGREGGKEGVMGTPAYMAPEQKARPEEVDHRADIYSLGVVFYQMLTGELPAKQIEQPSRKVVIDVRLDEIVLRALEKEPERRYQAASEVKTQIETVINTPEIPPAVGVPPVGAPMPAAGGMAGAGESPRPGGESGAGVPLATGASRSDHARVLRKLDVAGAGLLVAGVADLLTMLVGVAGIVGMRGESPAMQMALGLLFGAGALVGGFLIVGGVQMLRRRGWRLAVAAAVAAIPAGLVGLWLPLSFLSAVALPLGVVALVVLRRRDVRDAFRAAGSGGAEVGGGPAVPSVVTNRNLAGAVRRPAETPRTDSRADPPRGGASYGTFALMLAVAGLVVAVGMAGVWVYCKMRWPELGATGQSLPSWMQTVFAPGYAVTGCVLLGLLGIPAVVLGFLGRRRRAGRWGLALGAAALLAAVPGIVWVAGGHARQLELTSGLCGTWKIQPGVESDLVVFLSDGVAAVNTSHEGDYEWRRISWKIEGGCLWSDDLREGIPISSVRGPLILGDAVLERLPGVPVEELSARWTFDESPVTRTLVDLDEGPQSGWHFLDLGRDSVSGKGTDMGRWSNAELLAWLNNNGFDLAVENAEGQWALVTTDLKLRVVSDAQWHHPPASWEAVAAMDGTQQAEGIAETIERDGWRYNVLAKNVPLPLTMAYQTRKGRWGLLRVMGLNSASHQMTVQYKRAQLHEKLNLPLAGMSAPQQIQPAPPQMQRVAATPATSGPTSVPAEMSPVATQAATRSAARTVDNFLMKSQVQGNVLKVDEKSLTIAVTNWRGATRPAKEQTFEIQAQQTLVYKAEMWVRKHPPAPNDPAPSVPVPTVARADIVPGTLADLKVGANVALVTEGALATSILVMLDGEKLPMVLGNPPDGSEATPTRAALGTLVKVEGPNLVVRSRARKDEGKEITVTTDPNTQALLDGQRISLDELKVGMSVDITSFPASGGFPAKLLVMATAKGLSGTIVRVDGKAVVVRVKEQGAADREVRVPVDAKTQVRFVQGGRNVWPRDGTLAELRPGMWVKVSPEEGTAQSILASVGRSTTQPTSTGPARVPASTQPANKEGLHLQFRLVAPAQDAASAADELEDPGHPGRKLRVLRTVLLDESALASAALQPAEPRDAGPTIGVVLTAEGGKAFARITAEHAQEQLAMVLDGKVLFAPVIRSPITGGRAVITFGRDTSREEAAKVVETLNAIASKEPAAADTRPAPAFMPVREVIVPDVKSPGKQYLSLESGEFFALPAEALAPALSVEARKAALKRWYEEKQIDLAADTSPEVRSLMGLDMVVNPVPAKLWEQLAPSELAGLREIQAGAFAPINGKGELPATYAFRTRSGALGLLQILAFQNQPPSVKLRYKLVRTAEPAASGPAATASGGGSVTQPAFAMPRGGEPGGRQVVTVVVTQEACEVQGVRFGRQDAEGIRAAVLKAAGTPPGAVLLSAKTDVPFDRVADVVRLLSEAGLKDVALKTQRAEAPEMPPAATSSARESSGGAGR